VGVPDVYIVCRTDDGNLERETTMKTTKTLTEKMAEKVTKAIERNQKAMVSADRKGDAEVVGMCARHHWRLAKIDRYLDDRNAR
jgi:hypothetical protein